VEESATTTNLKTEAPSFSDKFVTASELHSAIAWKTDLKCDTKTTDILLSFRLKSQGTRAELLWYQSLEMRPLRDVRAGECMEL
jgi:hypothetical protein